MNKILHVPLTVDGKDLIAEIILQPEGAKLPIRQFCDAIGLSSSSQREKITKDPRFSWSDIRSTGIDEKQYSMFCLPVEQIVPWLFTINSNKIKNLETRENLLRFQTHLGRELNAVAAGQLSSEETRELKQMVTTLAQQVRQLAEQLRILAEENATLRQTNEDLWRARSFESSASSYGMHSAKARKRALTKKYEH